MKKNDTLVVHCEYAKADMSLSHLLEESFRLYLARVLAAAENSAASWER